MAFHGQIETILSTEGPLTSPFLLKMINGMGEWTGQTIDAVDLIKALHAMYHQGKINRFEHIDGKHYYEFME